jgi:hypothetical protein
MVSGNLWFTVAKMPGQGTTMRTIWVASLLAALMPVGVVDIPCAHAGDFGKSEYMKSCAACHGVSGKGDGPAAKTLAKSPPNLTRLSADNNGAFPLVRTYDVIDGRIDVVVHGPREMPVWGNVFKRDVKPHEVTCPRIWLKPWAIRRFSRSSST